MQTEIIHLDNLKESNNQGFKTFHKSILYFSTAQLSVIGNHLILQFSFSTALNYIIIKIKPNIENNGQQSTI